MLMRKGECWLCPNPYCGGNLTLRAAYDSREDPPRCACGNQLRKVSASTRLSYLDFLKTEESVTLRKPAKKE
ncbi:MAG: hypothetical protein PVS2B2_17500 [Candidatus Acidiferrum sp.]